jgi:hypothetical protein
MGTSLMSAMTRTTFASHVVERSPVGRRFVLTPGLGSRVAHSTVGYTVIHVVLHYDNSLMFFWYRRLAT